jgi:DNA-binding MarR family transcriptional regulator
VPPRPVDRVVEAGLVVQENSLSDRRSIHVVLTPAGHEVLETREVKSSGAE